jgi:hypothetical protein
MPLRRVDRVRSVQADFLDDVKTSLTGPTSAETDLRYFDEHDTDHFRALWEELASLLAVWPERQTRPGAAHARQFARCRAHIIEKGISKKLYRTALQLVGGLYHYTHAEDKRTQLTGSMVQM